MAKKSVCSACGMTMDGEKKFCPACGGTMNVEEVADANIPASQMPQTETAPVDTFNGMDNIPPVPPMDDTMNNIPPMNNNMGGIPPMNAPMNNIPPMNMQPQQPQSAPGGGFAIAGMILGIISIPGMCFGWWGSLVGVVGLILSILGLKCIPKKGMATAGLICSAIGIVGGIILTIISLMVVGEVFDLFGDLASSGDLEDAFEYYDYY